MQVTDDLIRNVVQEVLVHMKKGALTPGPSPKGRGENSWGVFENVDDAVANQRSLAAQVLFYCWAGLGFFFYQHMRRVRYGLVPYFLFAMHLAFIVGFFRCLVGADRAVWQKVS